MSRPAAAVDPRHEREPTALQLATSAVLDPLRSFEAQLGAAAADALLATVDRYVSARRRERARKTTRRPTLVQGVPIG